MPSKKTRNEPKKSETASGKGVSDSEQQIVDHEGFEIHDFIYHDSRRIATFLAQFHEYGLRNQVKANEVYGRTTSSKTIVGASAGVPNVAQGKADWDTTTQEDERDSAESVYDPLWTNARDLRNYLEVRDMVKPDIETAGIGQFVQVKGTFIILDVAMLKEAWDKPSLNAIIRSGINQLPEEIRNDPGRMKSAVAELDVVLDVLSILPHTTQAQLITEKHVIWFTLNKDALVSTASDIVLKHGSIVPGRWNMLGILDGLPDWTASPDKPGNLTSNELAAVNLAATMAGKMTAHLEPITRNLLGRPRGTFGMTPLMIYRNVS